MITYLELSLTSRFTIIQLSRRQVCLPNRILFLYRLATHHLISVRGMDSVLQCLRDVTGVAFVSGGVYDFLSRSSSARRKVYVVYIRSFIVMKYLPRRV